MRKGDDRWGWSPEDRFGDWVEMAIGIYFIPFALIFGEDLGITIGLMFLAVALGVGVFLACAAPA